MDYEWGLVLLGLSLLYAAWHEARHDNTRDAGLLSGVAVLLAAAGGGLALI